MLAMPSRRLNACLGSSPSLAGILLLGIGLESLPKYPGDERDAGEANRESPEESLALPSRGGSARLMLDMLEGLAPNHHLPGFSASRGVQESLKLSSLFFFDGGAGGSNPGLQGTITSREAARGARFGSEAASPSRMASCLASCLVSTAASALCRACTCVGCYAQEAACFCCCS